MRQRYRLMCLLALASSLLSAYFIASMVRFDMAGLIVRMESAFIYAGDEVSSDEGWQAHDIDGQMVIGWITVPGTSIDQPIVQAPADDPDYYLDHAPDGSFAGGGTVYVDASCAGLDDCAPLIYGHHLRTGGMFSDFARFVDEEYAREHGDIRLLTTQGSRRLQVVGVRVVDALTEGHGTRRLKVEEVPGKLAECLSGCDVTFEFATSPTRFYTFCTCGSESSGTRVLVYAVEYPTS